MFSMIKLSTCVGIFLIISANTISHNQKLFYISFLKPPNNKYSKDFSCNIFFGSNRLTLDNNEYKKQIEWDDYFANLDDSTDTSGLPLAPENEDDPIEDVDNEDDLTKPPTCKKDWNLKRIAHGRRFWHRFFATPSDQTLNFAKWSKFHHDRYYCNRIYHKEITYVPKIEQKKTPDGKLIKLTKNERNKNRHRERIKRTLIGYNNSSKESNLLILANYPQERKVKLVERLRMPGVLDLRNYELLRLLNKTMLFLSMPNRFVNAVNFLLCFGRLNTQYKSEFKKFIEIPEKPKRRFRPMVYAIIGKLKCDPFPEDLLLPRKAKAPPIRDPYPVYNEPTSLVNRFLDSCMTLSKMKIWNTPYNHDETMDRSFSDLFGGVTDYTTKQSENKIDCPAVINFEEEMGQYLRPKESIDEEGVVGWTPADVRNMLKWAPKIGMTRVETLITRIKNMHNDLGLSYEEIIKLGKTKPRLLRYGSYKRHCLKIYDIDEGFTHEMVNELVRKFPNLLTYNVDRCIKPKIFYFTRNIGRTLDDLLEFPKYLSFSLYDRIIPRHFAVMNKYYDGEFLAVYRFLFETGFYHSYGQPVTHPKIPNPLPDNHEKYMESYLELSRKINLRELLCTSNDKFCEIFKISYRNLVVAKDSAFKIPLPANIV